MPSLIDYNNLSSARSRSAGERFRRAFGRRTSSGELIPEIDGLRFPAIAIVVLGHLSSFFLVRGGYDAPHTVLDRIAATPERFAGEGVVLFFVISGFVLALPFARYYRGNGEPVSLRVYFLRRLTRLEPPYLLTLGVLVGLEIVAASHHVAGRSGTPPEIVTHGFASAAYLHNFIFGEPSSINPPAWSLEIEVQFYILVPLLAGLFRIRSTQIRRGTIASAALAGCLFQSLFGATHPRWSLSIAGQLQFFLMGFLLADLYLFSQLLTIRGQYRWDFVALIGWASIFFLWQRGAFAVVLLPFVALGTFIAVFRGRCTNRVFRNPWITTIGGMCYSIYLIHFELIAALGRLARRVTHPTELLWRDMVIEGLPVLILTLGVCIAFYYCLERPCMDRHWPRKAIAWAIGRKVRSDPAAVS